MKVQCHWKLYHYRFKINLEGEVGKFCKSGLSTILENWTTHPARTHPALLEKKLHRVSHPEEIWGHQFQLGVLRGP